MKRPIVLVLMLCAYVLAAFPRPAFSQFSVPDQQYRCPQSEPRCRQSAKKLPAFEQGAGYTINFVEVSDKGNLWDERQLTEALDQIEKAREGGKKKPTVFVYIHGWQNNADEPKNDPTETDCLKLNGDVAKFRKCGVEPLAGLSNVEGAGPVVGIYLAWRGLSSTIEPVKHLFSYWPRRNKARFVGREGMFKALDAIVKKVAEHRSDYTVVMVGHSFGARVLEYAAEAVDPGQRHCGFMQRFRERVSGRISPTCAAAVAAARSTPGVKPPVDLFVYVNAATSHRMTYTTLHEWEWICAKEPSNPVCGAHPMYFATSSRTDFATAFLLPVANLVAPAFKADRLHLISAANTPWLHTHHDPKKAKAGAPELSPDSFCFDAPPNNHDQNGLPVRYCARAHDRIDQRYFWVLNTGHRLIRNHGDVWNRRVFNMVLAVYEKTLAEKKQADASAVAAGGEPAARQ